MIANIFRLPAPTITKLNFLKSSGWRIPKMYIFTYLTFFTFKLEPTEVQDAVKKPNFILAVIR